MAMKAARDRPREYKNPFIIYIALCKSCVWARAPHRSRSPLRRKETMKRKVHVHVHVHVHVGMRTAQP
jgi:hypothetical protein